MSLVIILSYTLLSQNVKIINICFNFSSATHNSITPFLQLLSNDLDYYVCAQHTLRSWLFIWRAYGWCTLQPSATFFKFLLPQGNFPKLTVPPEQFKLFHPHPPCWMGAKSYPQCHFKSNNPLKAYNIQLLVGKSLFVLYYLGRLKCRNNYPFNSGQ